MGNVSLSVNNDVLTFTSLKHAKTMQVKPGDVRYARVLELLKAPNNEDALVELMTVSRAVNLEAEGVSFKNGYVLYNGETVHHMIADDILKFTRLGLPVKPHVHLLNKLMRNPSRWIVDSLYEFSRKQGLTIDEDGDLLCYKAITANWLDKWTKTISNAVGATPNMPRNQVEDDRNKACGPGLHCGGIDYVAGYGSGDDRIIIVKVNPENVVSIPTDCGCQKMRTCGYTVVKEYDGNLNSLLYTSKGEPVAKATVGQGVSAAWLNDDKYFDNGGPNWPHHIKGNKPDVQPREKNGRFASKRS